ncbi:MAG: hypothetical protein RL684_317 [Pseudomonadota bacterium]
MPARKQRQGFPIAIRAAVLAATLLLGACSHLARVSPSHWHMPWHHKQAASEPPAQELVLEGSEQGLPQVWVRNTLQADLGAFAGEGTLTLRRAPGHDWPIRLALQVRAGSFGHLEVHGDQRVVLAVPAEGGAVLLQVPPRLYSSSTASLTLKYGP